MRRDGVALERVDEPARFSVDTHLFRELGELLVGRESTALIELVKNAYDADATEVVVFGQHLRDPSKGTPFEYRTMGIGGMSPETFSSRFLRIASRLKNTGARRSPRWQRRFTGAKGIGRLAAHKLARYMEVHSTPWSDGGDDDLYGVDGHINWDEIEEAETLDTIGATAITARRREIRRTDKIGTVLSLSNLRQRWTTAQLGRFLLEVDGLRPPPVVCAALPRRVVVDETLFDVPRVVDVDSDDPGLVVRLEGDFEVGENYWPAVLESATWLLEIDASRKAVKYLITPLRTARKTYSDVRQRAFSEPHPSPETGPFFHSRLLIREGQARGGKDERAWSSRMAGVRVYMEGFRVLPYGDDSDDWLALSRDTNERTRKLRFLVDSSAAGKLDEVGDEGLFILPNKHYFGAVFLTMNRAPALQMLVNREGFVPNESFESLVVLVRRGVDLATRVRAAARASNHEESEAGEGSAEDDESADDAPKKHRRPRSRTQSLAARSKEALELIATHAQELRQLAETVSPPLARKLHLAADEIASATEASKDALPANSMVLVLASVGTQLAAFTHEVNRLLSQAADVETRRWPSSRDVELSSRARSLVSKVAASSSELRRAIERQAAYLVDIITPDARRRRSRQRVGEILAAAWKLVEGIGERR